MGCHHLAGPDRLDEQILVLRFDLVRETRLILTTGTFTGDARKEATRDGVPPIELVDGEKLVTMFERAELGLKPRQTYEVDVGFFKEFKK